MTSNVRLVWNNPNQPVQREHVLALDAFAIAQFLELAALVDDTRLIFNADGSVTIEAPPICLPDERPRPMWPVPGLFGAA